MRTILFAAAVFALFAGASARAEEPAAEDVPQVKSDDFPEMFRLIDADSGTQAAYKACPADIWDSGRPIWRRVWDAVIGDADMEDGDCDKDPLACLASCLDNKSATACFQSARTLQNHAGRKNHASWEALFAQACALGHPAGCTNRASGALNGGYDGDPMPKPEEPAAAICIFRSFDIACAADDPWGCTMHGTSFQYGRGAAINKAKARAAFDKSCRIAPDFVACEMARSQTTEMDAPDEEPDDVAKPGAAEPDGE